MPSPPRTPARASATRGITSHGDYFEYRFKKRKMPRIVALTIVVLLGTFLGPLNIVIMVAAIVGIIWPLWENWKTQ